MGGCNTKILKETGRFHSRQPILDCADTSRAINDDIPLLTVSFVRRGKAVADAAVRCRCKALRVEVDNAHRRVTGSCCKLCHKQTHRAGAIHQHVVTQASRQHIPPTNRTGKWFDQSRVKNVCVALEPVHILRRTQEVLLRCAIRCDHAKPVPESTEAVVTVQAKLALTARCGRINGDSVADRKITDSSADPRTHLNDCAGCLVAGDQRKDCAFEFSVEDVGVGSTYPHRRSFDKNFLESRYRNVTIFDCQAFFGGKYYCAHHCSILVSSSRYDHLSLLYF